MTTIDTNKPRVAHQTSVPVIQPCEGCGVMLRADGFWMYIPPNRMPLFCRKCMALATGDALETIEAGRRR